MHQSHRCTLILTCLLLLSLASYASAVAVVHQEQVNPPGENLMGGTLVNASAELEIIPSGATTFSETHTLTLSTDLEDAHWQIAVIVDGLQAAVIPKGGNRVFINGFLLSYPTTSDVSVNILLEGRVPSQHDTQEFKVLRFAELNSQGVVVSESEHVITRKILSNWTPTLPAQTEILFLQATPSERAPLSWIPSLGALFTVFSWILIRRRE